MGEDDDESAFRRHPVRIYPSLMRRTIVNFSEFGASKVVVGVMPCRCPPCRVSLKGNEHCGGFDICTTGM